MFYVFRRYASTVELVAHEAHMHEHWHHIHDQYQKVFLNKHILKLDYCKSHLWVGPKIGQKVNII